jgi:hypothetical protein
MCSWEGSESPKLADRVRILASLLAVSPLSSGPWSVTESHATLRRSLTRFDSWRGHQPGSRIAAGIVSSFPASVSGARRSSKPQGRVLFPGGGWFASGNSRPRSVPDSHTTPRRSETRFDSWRGHRQDCSSPRPNEDAGARRPGDRLQPGSSGFDSHRRLFSSKSTAPISKIGLTIPHETAPGDGAPAGTSCRADSWRSPGHTSPGPRHRVRPPRRICPARPGRRPGSRGRGSGRAR